MSLERGPKFVSGQIVDGQLILTRADGSTSVQPVVFVSGTLIDNADNTFSLGS